ncbi:hypothetical protein GDO78_011433 [Eleutherodactylus coqui]|uniref:Uncharacterized protein n=1 Tax=Eleutherodactylus coqui TaxID=57060 RepID=A0A8J6F8V9_ELECQ|nr:hypothetical protein GDO78_011433 [Eleutherodactylus coqui]
MKTPLSFFVNFAVAVSAPRSGILLLLHSQEWTQSAQETRRRHYEQIPVLIIFIFVDQSFVYWEMLLSGALAGRGNSDRNPAIETRIAKAVITNAILSDGEIHSRFKTSC